MHRLRSEAEVAHHRDAGADDARDHLGVLGAALELDRLHPALGDQADGVPDRLVGRSLVRAEGQVPDQVGALRAAGDGGAVVDHLVHGDRERALLPLHHHADRVADQQHLDPGLVEEAREAGVVGGEHGDALARLLHLAQRVDGDLLQGSPPGDPPVGCPPLGVARPAAARLAGGRRARTVAGTDSPV